MAPRDDRVQSEKEESGRFQSTDSHQQGRGQARTKEYPGQSGHQSPRLDPVHGRDLSQVQPSTTGIRLFRSSLVARKSAQSYQPTGRPRGRPTNKSRSRNNGLPLPGVPSAGRYQPVTRSNGAEIDKYTSKGTEEETSNGKNDRMKNSGDVQIPQGRSDPKEDLGSYKRSGLSVITAGPDVAREYRPANDEPTKSRIKRTSEISLECRPQGRSTDLVRNRTLSTGSQFSPPPELKSDRPLIGLGSSAPTLHRNFNRPGLVTGRGRSGTDIVTSAMSVSSGSTPPNSYPQLGQKRPRTLDFTFCRRCGKPSTPENVLIRCSECDTPYHSLCHRPNVTPNYKIWKCQRCKYSEQQSNASTPMGQSSNSTTSETSASSVTSAAALIPLPTGPSFKPGRSDKNGTNRPWNVHARLENFHSYSDDDRLRKRFKGDTSAQNQWSSEDTALGRVYGDLEYGELARSKIFHGSQTFAVVIGSRSRSTSASADGKQSNHQGGHQDFERSVAAKISHGTSERLTKRTSITSRSSPPPLALTSYNEDPSFRKQARLPSEIKDSQEMDYERIDTQMSLDSPELHSPIQERTTHNYKVHSNMASETLGGTVSYWGPHEQNGPLSRYERPFPEDSSPQYPPSVGDRERNENERSINRECREESSPPYSPPPPNVDVSYEGPVKDLTHTPLPQTTRQEEPKNSDNWLPCVMCNFYIQNNGQYKNNICGACAVKVPPRSSRAIQEPPQPTTAQRTARKIRHQASQKTHRRRIRRHPKQFNPTLSMGFQNHETPKHSAPEELSVSADRKFQTSKDRVNAKYPMNEPVPSKPRAISVLRKNKDGEPIKNTQELRASCDIPDKGGKPEAVATNGEFRRPVRPSDSTGPARKFPSTPAPHESPPPGVEDTERPVSRNDDNHPKRIPRRPAVKNAGGSIQFTDSDDSDEPVSDRAKIIMLEKRLAEQRSCTKNQRNAARRLQEKLTEATRETKRVREEFSAKLAQARKIKKSDPVKQNISSETKAGDLLVKLTTGKLAAVPLKLKDLYKDIEFTASSPWPCPPELPEPDPRTFRKPGWRKQQKRAPEYDTERLMKVHLHRQLIYAKTQPPKIIPGSLHDLNNTHVDTRSNSLDDEYSEYSLGPETTIDEFLGFPENMVPAVKDGVLGFRPGIINQRTRRLDRNVQHYKVRAPGALLDRI